MVKHLLNFVISKLAQTHNVQKLLVTPENIANSISDQIRKYEIMISFPKFRYTIQKAYRTIKM